MTAGVTVVDTEVHGDPAQVYLPDGDERLPLVLLLHGSHVHPRHYTTFAPMLAAEGFVVVVPEHRRELFGEVAHYPQQAQAAWAVAWGRAEDSREGSPLAGRVDADRFLMVGHSFGGAVTLAVASGAAVPGLHVEPWTTPPELRAVVVNGTHNVPPPRTGEPLPVDNVVPLAYLQGSTDGTVRADQAEATFAVTRNAPRLYVELEGANHYFVTNDDEPGDANADRGGRATLASEASIATAARWTARWFHAQLGDDHARELLRAGAGDDEPYVRVEYVER